MKMRGVFLVLAVLLASYSFACAQEQLVLTTYYPSPAGVYSELQLFPKRRGAAGNCAVADDEGKMYYDSWAHKLLVCQDVSGTIGWQEVSTGAGYWDLSADETQLYTHDTAWSVGIGTTNPDSTLTVIGGVDPFHVRSSTESSWDSIAYFENSAGGGAMAIRANGRVQIGLNSLSGSLDVAGPVNIDGQVTIRGGSPGAGRVLTSSDAAGNATWQSPAGVNCSICIDCDPDGGNKNGTEQCVAVGSGWSDYTGDLSHDGEPDNDNVRCRISMSCS